MRNNVFVIGLDDFHRELLETVEDADRIRFHPLLTAEEIANPVDCRIDEVLHRTKRILDGFDGTVDAIIGHWDFPTSTILPILVQYCGLPGPSLETVLRCEHKYWSRLEQRKSVPGHIPDFFAFAPFSERPREQIGLDYPFWIKPIKAHSSYLSFKVRNDVDFELALAKIRQGIAIVARPFNEILQLASLPCEIAEVDGWHCIAEEDIASGFQCTVEGYAFNGAVHGYGYVDSDRAGHHSSTFVGYHYPSRLPAEVHARMEAIARAFLLSIGYDGSPFNMEFFYDRETERLSLVEVNTRISKSHCPLFYLVDGASHHQVAVQLALGEEPNFPSRRGAWAHAAKFMLRHLGADARIRRLPRPQEMDRLYEAFPELRLKLLASEGARLSDLALQEPYSYELAEIFLGGRSESDLRDRYDRLCALMPFELEPSRGEALMAK